MAMSDAFDAAMPFVLRWEGGFVNHPNDPGGATNKGVTQKVYDGWRTSQGQGTRSVRELETAEMLAIYRSEYWQAAKCPELPGALDQAQFDTAVNMGVGRSIRFLQQAVGATVDGGWGPNTVACVAACDPGTALVAYCKVREDFYRGIVARKPSQGVFLKGWMNRLNALRKELGLPGFESVGDTLDFGDTAWIQRVPDIGEDPELDRP
jgi:lysozyme family protein